MLAHEIAFSPLESLLSGFGNAACVPLDAAVHFLCDHS